MTERAKVNLTLTPEAIAVLEKHTTERKRGEFVSHLLVAYGLDGGAINQVDVESMKMQLLGLASSNKTLEVRVLRIERLLSSGQKGGE